MQNLAEKKLGSLVVRILEKLFRRVSYDRKNTA